jgi:hypothetical protein
MAASFRTMLAVVFLLLLEGCTQTGIERTLSRDLPPPGGWPKVLAVYEPWFGHPEHISVGYSSQDPVVIRRQMDEARQLGISGFVVDWYGDREPFVDRSYALLQSIAAEKQFRVAMMYDETQYDNGHVTEDTLAAFRKFHESYLANSAPGRQAYLTYHERPVVFIFPKSGRTDWNRVRRATDQWDPRPLLVYEDGPTPFASAFDGVYAWINPGKKGWTRDGSNWGEDYLRDYYSRMSSQPPDKLVVGAAWAGFDDSKASWGLGRYMSQRCGQTLADTIVLYRQYYPPEHPLPFLLIATWNDYEEGTAIERGLVKCTPPSRQ